LQNKINQLSLIEQNIQNFALQKQQFQTQLMELESAEKELEDSKEAFKIIGNIMVASDKEKIKKEFKKRHMFYAVLGTVAAVCNLGILLLTTVGKSGDAVMAVLSAVAMTAFATAAIFHWRQYAVKGN